MSIAISPVNMEERKTLGIKPGDTVRVQQKVKEKDGFRLQAFEGLVLAVKHGSEAGSTFTVRKVASGVGVEKVFPLFSPMIDKIEVLRRSKVRRAKLYYIRDKVSREMKRALRRMTLVNFATKGGAEVAAEEAAAKAVADAEEAAVKAAIEAEAAVVADATGAEAPAVAVEEAKA
ncbi:MAG: 50S ribosomal protein L19 [Candidatus Pacebacteria bacterium]|nr:50S ribosomal protein L19 [Candidatus Paceibacterota bacterium]